MTPKKKDNKNPNLPDIGFEQPENLCVLILKESLAKGNDIHIPSLGTTIYANEQPNEKLKYIN